MRLLIRILLSLLGLFVLLVVVAIIVIANYDWNRQKPWVTETVSHALNRKLTIDGDLQVHWERDPTLHGISSMIPGPHISAAKVTLGNPTWSKSPYFATVGSIEMDMSLLPLLVHTISIPAVRFVDPDVHLERISEKQNNWTFGGDDNGGGSSWKVDPGRVQFSRGNVTIVDRVKDLDMHIRLDSLHATIPFNELVAQQESASHKEAAERVGATGAKQIGTNKPIDEPKNDTDKNKDDDKQSTGEAAAPPEPSPNVAKDAHNDELQHYAFLWNATGTLHGKPVKGEGRTGGVLALKRADRPFPMQADIRFGDTRIAFIGTLTDPTSPDALDLRLWLSGESLAQLYDVIEVALPESPPYATEGRLVGHLATGKEKLRYENFTARVGESDLDGNLLYENKSPRPLLSGQVNSKSLQFRDLAPLVGARPPSDDDKSPAPAANGKVLPEEPFKPERWKVMDADVRFTGDHVFRDSELPIHKVDTRIRMDNAVLSLDPMKFKFAYGDVDASMKMDGSDVPIKGQIKATAKEIEIKRLFKLSDPSQLDIGNANATLELHGSGNSVGDLLGAANGQVKALVGSGHVSKALMEEAALNVPNIVIAKIFGDQQVEINCAAANLEANSGTYYARLVMIDTDVAQITIDGTIDLASEKLDLTVHPNTKGLRLLSLRSPIHVTGTFKKPDIGIDKGILLARSAGAVGLAVVAAPAAALLPLTAGNLGSKGDDRCGPLLESMQKTPAVPPPKSSLPSSAKKAK